MNRIRVLVVMALPDKSLAVSLSLKENADVASAVAIAEKDLEIRGPGEILGSQQTGVLPFRYANLVRDNKYLTDTKNIAERIYDADKEKANQLMKRWISGIISYADA